MSNIEELYKKRIECYTLQKQNLDKKSRHFSILRLLCFLALGVSIYRCFVAQFPTVQIIMSALFLIFFLWLVKRHDKIQRQRDWAERLLLINNNEFKVLLNQPSIFDNGNIFFSTEAYYYDLDIFGEQSVYHLLNRTGTQIGAKALAKQLKKPTLDADTILQKQNAIKELSEKIDFRQEVLAAAMADKGKVSDIDNVETWASSKTSLVKAWWKYVLIAAPALFAASLVYSIIAGNYYLVSLMYVLNLGANYFISKGINNVHSKLAGAGKLLGQYANIFRIIGNEKFTNNMLSGIFSISHNADKHLQKLSSIVNLFDQRMNLLVALFFNPIFFYDLQCILMLERWKKHYAADIDKWFDGLAQIEVLNSLSTYAFNNPHYITPNILSNKQIVWAKNLSHPLIPAGKRVSNSFDFGNNSKVILITGSNMSGKSTFLRTVGVNMLLASCGAPVCADEFNFCPVKIYTSLRQSDSLQEDTSFFYAELKKLSEIVKHLEAGEQAIVLLDEVLKGTNSDDKTYGSQELIRKLVHFDALSLIATHDISLGRIENESGGQVENYCFESKIENDELLFDYKLRKGIAVNKNATFLMKKMGIIDIN